MNPRSKTIIRQSPEDRKRMVEDVLLRGKSVNEITKLYNVSRKTYAKWKKRYSAEKELSDANPKGVRHPKGASQEAYDRVLELVRSNPALSCHKIAETLRFVGNHGVQNILNRLNLTTFEQRMNYSYNFNRSYTVQPAAASPLAYTELDLRTQLIRAFSVSLVFGVIISSFFIIVAGSYGAASSVGQGFGISFAILALMLGTFFFLYSSKYYITLALVLSFSQKDQDTMAVKVGNPAKKFSFTNFFNKILGIESDEGEGSFYSKRATGMEPDLSRVKLNRHPYVSVQIPFYNEKNVAERAIMAAINLEYEGDFEVFVCDDSTDETTDIVKRIQEKYLKKGQKLKIQKGEGWVLSEVKVRPGVLLKHLHRTSRSGFKGGALKMALTLVDPRCEFVSVFDADFVPYPDSLIQFLKYFKLQNNMSEDYRATNVAAVQGYQWHVLNKSENWITRGIRSEYAGSYVIERSGEEIYGGMKQISGSVYMIRRDVLQKIGWETSITEDFELTLKLYNAGYKVVYTPYIQAPAECVSTIKGLIRQRMRWAEGHSFNVKKMFGKIMSNPKLTLAEKFEFVYLAPYYLQAFFFLVGTFAWLVSEIIFKTKLPFWTALWGWSLILSNMLALPLMNAVGIFMEEGEQRDYMGTASFVALSYIVVPFQAYAALKGFFEKEEGGWFRTPKSGRVTDIFKRSKFYRFIEKIISGYAPVPAPVYNPYLSLVSANNQFESFRVKPRQVKWLGNLVFTLFIVLTIGLVTLSPFIPTIQSVQAKTPGKVATVADIVSGAAKPSGGEEQEINTPMAIQREYGGKTLDFIFHKEPRVRIKYDGKEMEIETLAIAGAGSLRPQRSVIKGSVVTYLEIVDGVDLVYEVGTKNLTEKFIVKKPLTGSDAGVIFNGIEQKIITKEVKVVSPDPKTFGFYTNDNKLIFSFSPPTMWEKDKPEIKSTGLEFTLEKAPFGYTLKKTLTQDGQVWFNDPKRSYPLVIDPSVVVSGGIEEAEVQFGGQQRKLVFVSSNWYAFYNCDATTCTGGATGGKIFYKKSSDGSSWGSVVDVDSTGSTNYNPSIDLSTTTIYVAWIDTSTNSIEVNSINTASSDALGTKCAQSPGTISSTYMVSIAVSSNGTVYVATTDTGAGTVAKIYKLVFSGCTFTDITSAPTSVNRFYLPSTGTPSVTPAYSGSWTGSANGDRIQAVTTKISSAMATKTANALSGSGAENVLIRQYTTRALAAQTVTGTIKGNMRAIESSTNFNGDVAVHIRVVSNDGNTFNATTPLAITSSTTTSTTPPEMNTSLTNRRLLNSSDATPITLTNTTINDGDRLVIEFGAREVGTSTTRTGGISFGDVSATDLAEDDTTTTANNPWINFNTAVTFLGSGLTAGDRLTLVTIGNSLHMIYQDGDLSDSVYDGTDWVTSNKQIANVTDSTFSVVTDGTSLWVLTVSGTTATNFYGCSSCAVQAPSWSVLTAPWTGQTNLTSASLSYDSTNSRLYAHVIKDASEQAYVKDTAKASISWGTEYSYGFTAGNLGHISANETGAGSAQIGVVLRQGTNFEFATVPENVWFLLLLLPFLPAAFKRLKKERYR